MQKTLSVGICCLGAGIVGRLAAGVELLATSYFTDESCQRTPQVLTMDFTYDTGAAAAYVAPSTILESSGILTRRLLTISTCVGDSSCTAESYGGNTYYRTSECITDPYTYAVQVFNDSSGGVLQPFLMVETYTGGDCATLSTINATAAANGCQFASENSSSSATLFSNGSALYRLYDNGACGGEVTRYFVDQATLLNHTCFRGTAKFYTNYDATASKSSGSSGSIGSTGSSSTGEISTPTPTVSSSSSGIGTGALVGIIVGALVLLVFVVFAVCRRRSSSGKEEDVYRAATQGRSTVSTRPNTLEATPHGLEGLWDDEVITTARIPREKVIVEHRINRGAYGEVFAGAYNGKLVAVKMLLTENRKSIRHVNEFLAEVKRTATLDHPRIVGLIGVAWDSLTDLCAVLEYMDGGDLRVLLDKLQAQGHRPGFDRAKVKIALHVAHALAYLHSLERPIIHRDLKSKNILLNEDLDAKVTDFGISRERIAETMTAGIGTSLWMAPEVLLGEKYDDKADMFSFGVVLSELDTHRLPYASATKTQLSETVVLQLVASGKLRVEFSPYALTSLVELGRACTFLDSQARPTAAEALYKLHTILSQEFGGRRR